MTGSDVLIDLLQTNQRFVHVLLDEIDKELLHWQHDDGANSIGVIVWHIARILDVFLVQKIEGRSAESELWHANGWAERTNYDPTGIGHDGWGNVIGYTIEEVAAIPQMDVATLLGYYDEVIDSVLAAFQSATLYALVDEKRTAYSWLKAPLMDNIRHVGEIMAIKSSWKRR